MAHAAWRVARVGLVAAAIVWMAGSAVGRNRFGATASDTLQRVEAELKRQVATSADTVGRIAAGLTSDRAALMAALRAPAVTARARLFDAVDAAVATQEPGRTGLTIYDSRDNPLAWAGRTSDLPKPRLDGPSTLFIAP